MERARRYGVRGLKQLAHDNDADWEGGPLGPEPYDEARLDADRDAMEIITIHSAKGLEWPVVIPINMGSELRRLEPFIHRRHDDTLQHWVLGDVVPPAIADAISRDDRDSAEERERNGTRRASPAARSRERVDESRVPTRRVSRKSWAARYEADGQKT